MSDIEEPPQKVTKFEMESQYLEGEVMEEGQEEWLSEGILTDEDTPAPEEQDRSDSNLGNTSQGETIASANDSIDTLDNSQEANGNDEHKTDKSDRNDVHRNGDANDDKDKINEEVKQEDIEDTLNNLENSYSKQSQDLPGELNTFLVRKTDVKSETKREIDKETDMESENHSDDGNDTDDLLRMLGDGDDRKKKKLTLKREKKGEDASSDDDEYIFEGAKIKTLQMAKNVLIRKYPATKAEPEDDDMSSDEVTLKKMFLKAKPSTPARRSLRAPAQPKANQPQKKTVKHVVSVTTKAPQPKLTTPVKQYSNRRSKQPGASLLKSERDPDELVCEEFLDENELDLDEVSETKPSQQKQRIMRPEQMDEEVPTDGESESDDESLYDELPSSDSENVDEWFTLDIRAERAGDYIPLLGEKAHQLLTEEKRKVSVRLSSLKKSVSALTGSAREQAERLRSATATLAELDAKIKAA